MNKFLIRLSAFALTIPLGLLVPQIALSASSWNPTLLVNTEAFQIVDDDDTASDVYIKFGDTIGEKLSFKRSASRFEFSRSLRVAGAITATGSIAASGSITAEGALSGASLHASGNASASGTLSVEGMIYAQAGVTGNASTATALAANGANCSAGQYPLGIDASGAVENCSVDQVGSTNTGALQTQFDSRYVNVSGDTMTGHLVLQGKNLTATGVYATGSMSASGALSVEGIAYASNFISNISTGTQPYAAISTTLNTNLNADLLDSQHGAYYLDSANFTGTNWTDLTDAGATTLHKHDHGGMDGLADDDHTQYQKETDFTAGSVLFRGASAITEDNANLFWDDTNNRLGIGTATPITKLSVAGVISGGNAAVPDFTPNQSTGIHSYEYLTAGGGTQTTKSYGNIFLYNSDNIKTTQFASYAGTVNYINNGGNVGIGTTNPTHLLDVYGDGGIYSNDSSGIGRFLSTGSTGVYYGSVNATGVTHLYAGNAEAVTILANGNVGIGTTSPQGALEVSQTSGSTHLILRNPTEAVNSVDTIRFLTGAGAAADANQVATIYSIITQADPSALIGDLVFATNVGDNSSEKMRITGAGYVGIGDTTPTIATFTVEKTGDVVQALFGDTDQVPSLYISTETSTAVPSINAQYGYNGSDGILALNYHGYLNANTQFRDLGVYDGKTNMVMFVDGSAGNVGIGTTGPDARLMVDDAGTAASYLFHIQADDGNPWALAIGNDQYSTSNFFKAYTSYLGDFIMTAAGTSTADLVIDVTGAVGIGTTGPDQALHVQSAGEANTTFGSSWGDIGIQSEITDNTAGNWNGLAFSSDSDSDIDAAIGVEFDDHTSDSEDTNMHIYTKGGGTLGDRVRILSGGNVIIGPETAMPADTSNDLLTVHRNSTTGVVRIGLRNDNDPGVATLRYYYGTDPYASIYQRINSIGGIYTFNIMSQNTNADMILGAGGLSPDDYEALRIKNTQDVIVNELGGDNDFRVEGDTDANLIYSDASADRVGIGNSLPTAKLMIDQNANGTGALVDSEATAAPVLALDGFMKTNAAPHILFGYKGLFDVNLYRSGANELKTDDTFVAGNNLGVNTSTFGTNAAGVIAIKNGTAPSSSPADSVQLYAEDVEGSSELRVRDEAGNVTTQSPHSFILFIPDENEEFPWSYYSKNEYLGKEINVDMAGAIREVEALSGKQFIYLNDIEEADWEDNQNENEQSYIEEEKQRQIGDKIKELKEIPREEAFEKIEVKRTATGTVMETVTGTSIELVSIAPGIEIPREWAFRNVDVTKTVTGTIIVTETGTAMKIVEVNSADAFTEVEIMESVQTGTGTRFRYTVSGSSVIVTEYNYPIYGERGTGKFEKRLNNGVSFDEGTGKFTKQEETITETQTERETETEITVTEERLKPNVWEVNGKYYRFDTSKGAELFDSIEITEKVQTGTGTTYEYEMINGEPVLKEKKYPIYETRGTGEYFNKLKNKVRLDEESGMFIKEVEAVTTKDVERITERLETATEERLKTGVIEKGNKYFRHFTPEEAEKLVNVKPFNKKNPPPWLKNRIDKRKNGNGNGNGNGLDQGQGNGPKK